MEFPSKISKQYWRGIAGAGLATLLGWILLLVASDDGVLTRLSYDLTFMFRKARTPKDCTIIFMDEKSHREMKQPWGLPWDRWLHARLLNRLTEDSARLVVFDVVLTEPGNESTNQLFAQAIRRNGRVVLAADLVKTKQAGIVEISEPAPPLPEFVEAARAWGLAEMVVDPDRGVRRIHPGTEDRSSLAWTAAVATGAALKDMPSERLRERWLNYYGPADTIDAISYVRALESGSGYFSNKVVFVGGKPRTRYPGEEVDQFLNPFTAWNQGFSSGVEIVATSFLNLLHHDWLERVAPWKEAMLVCLCGCLAGFGLSCFRPLWATVFASLGMVVVVAGTIWTASHLHVWFAWVIPVAAQIPCAYVWAVFFPVAQPMIPGHTLLRKIGKGSFGEVWLARDVFESYCAVKIVRQKGYSSIKAYEREFNGIRSFIPVSRKNLWLLQIFTAGRNDDQGYYYYVMELGDDESKGQSFDPATYSPRNLHRELERWKRLSVAQCVDMGMAIIMALEYLHSQQLIHRDIKPSNIIFVNDAPKLADIGLVMELDHPTINIAGTLGFLDQKNPGTMAADLYALGKVLYMAATGLGPEHFPNLPAGWEQWSEREDFLQLNDVIARACEPKLSERYPSAGAMRSELEALRARLTPNPQT